MMRGGIPPPGGRQVPLHPLLSSYRKKGARSVSEPHSLLLPQVTFYTKAGCHLCEQAREMLDDIATEVEYELTEIDIRSNLALFEQYRYRIPVIIVNATHIVEGRIDYRNLTRAFEP